MTGSAGYDADLTGYPIAAVDGDIGHIDKATNELLGASYLVPRRSSPGIPLLT